MSGFPDEVEAYYAELAEQRGWRPDTVQAHRASVELVRDLDRGTGARTFGARADEYGTDWLFEAVWHEREWVIVRQLQVGEDGTVLRYWWQRLEDEDGALTEEGLNREEWGLRPLSREDFYTAWDDPGWSLSA